MENQLQLTVVIGLVKDKEGRILLQKRADPLIPDADGKWEFPGGRINFGESPEAALKRECEEEVGVKVDIGRLLPQVQSAVWSRTDGKTQHVLIFCFEAVITEGEPRVSDRKVSEVRWFSLDEIAMLDTLRGIKDFFELAKQ
jgi:8-oxo-dGTP diphosphatase